MNRARAELVGAILFSFRAAVSAVAAVLVFDLFGWSGAVWAAVSAVIVTQPGMNPSIKASMTRITANVIGALAGAAFSALLGHSLWALALGVTVTGIACHLLRMDDALRPAFAAVVIVMFANEKGVWHEPLQRVLSVLAGCFCALAVGLIYDAAAKFFNVSPQSAARPGGTE